MAKSRNIIAIGGGGFGANPGQGIIEEYILKQTKKKNPKICFIPTATEEPLGQQRVCKKFVHYLFFFGLF